MTRIKKAAPAVLVFLLALCVCFGLASCGSKDTTPAYGYGEEGLYYYSASETEDYMLTLREGSFVLSMGTGYAGTYECVDGTVTFYEEGEEAGSGYATETGFGFTWEGRSYLFLRYEYYTVSFTDGGTTLSTQSVLNGKAASDPGEPGKEGYVFLGWYEDSDFTTRYEFNTSITADTTIYARFVEVEGTTEYKITYDFGNGETETTETLNGKIYDLPEAEMTGYTFLGWWVSATNQADELTYRYEGETLCEDTTLFAVFASGSYIGASVKEGTLTWLSSPAGTLDIYVEDEKGNITYYSASSTSASQPLSAVSGTGKYKVTVTSGGVTETLTYVSNGLARASGFTVISGSILMYGEVPGAERYYISIDCGTEGHDHTYIDNGSSLYYDFSSCEMPAEGITFTVYAYAEGYYYSSSSYNYFLGLDKTAVTVEGSLVSWAPVSYAMGYEVYIDGILVATTSDTSFSLSGYGTGTYEIAVKPITTGYYSELSETISFTKTTLASPSITGIEDYTITWTEVEGAAGYTVSINGTETTVGGGDITSLILSDDNYTEGLDSYEISVKAMAEDSNNDSPYGESITVTGASVGSAVSYNNGTVTWQYSLSASEYRITVNDGDETIVTGTNNSPVTLTKSGNNEITIYFIDEDGGIYGQASITVYAYAIVFDARGGTAYDSEGNEIDVMYVAKGDTVTLPTAERGVVTADFLGWYTLPDVTDDPDAVIYQGDGYLYEDGAVFTGNSTIVLYAFWINQRLTITLDPGVGTLTDDDGNAIDSVNIPINGRTYVIEVPECGDASYVFLGWYSGLDGTGERYTYEDGTAYRIFLDGSVDTLYAYWIKPLEFSVVTYNGVDVMSVSQGEDIGLVTEVTIPETTVYDGEEWTVAVMTGAAFDDCRNLKTINIPDTIIYMNIVNNGYDPGTGVFDGTALENVNIYATGEPSTTKEIIYYSEEGVLFWINPDTDIVELLYYPYGRTDASYSIPETVSNENEYELSGLSEVPVVRYVTGIGEYVFSGHNELTYMVIPDHITEFGTHTFAYCLALTGVEFEGNITEITYGMFEGCAALTTYQVPDSVKEIGDRAFYVCEALESIVVPEGVVTIGGYAFYKTGLKSFVMPDTVESVGSYLFEFCYDLETVVLSRNLKSTGDHMFYSCKGLTWVEMPYGLETIEQYTFYYTNSLKTVVLPDSVTSIEDYAFRDATGLEEITFSANLTNLGRGAFQNSQNLKGVTLPEGLTEIGSSAFNMCYGLTYANLPGTLEKIGSSAFSNCYNLTSIVIPASVTSIGSSAFSCCYRLVEVYNLSSISVTAGKSSTSNGYLGVNAKVVHTSLDEESSIVTIDGAMLISDIDGYYYIIGCDDTVVNFELPEDIAAKTIEVIPYAFVGCANLETVVLPDTVTAIGEGAFQDCASLRSVNIPYGVTVLDGFVFQNCVSLTEIEIPDSVTSIYNYTFDGCTGLTSVVIPDSVTTMGINAFGNCTNLVKVTIGKGINLNYVDSPFDGSYRLVEVCNLSSGTITAGSGDIGKYAVYVYTAEDQSHLTSENGYLYTYDNDGNYYLVAYYGDDRDITLPATLGGHGYEMIPYAFSACDALTGVTLPSGITTIGDYTFDACGSLRSVSIPDSVTSIGQRAFRDCVALESVSFGKGLASVGNYAFDGCESLKSVTVPDSVTSLGTYAFRDCTSLASAVLGTGLTSVPNYAFDGCESLRDVTIPAPVASLGNYAFRNCSDLEAIAIPDSVTSVGTYCFQSCTSLEDVKIGSGVTSIGNYAFDGCSKLKTVVIPDSVETIGTYVFRDCVALKSIVIGVGVTSIGNNAFNGCTKLATVYYAGTETQWNAISIGSTNNTPLTGAALYLYSEEKPTTTGGNWWHWDEDGNPAVWKL